VSIYIERCIMNASLEEIAGYSPDGGFRVDFLAPIKETLRRRRGLRKRRVVGLVSPTGAGKTSFLVALTSWLATRCGVKSTVLVSGKANRATVLLRFMEAVARAKLAGLKTPRVLVFASKIDTCIFRELEDIIAEYRSTDDLDEARKIANLFYSKERRVKENCPFLDVEPKYPTVRREVEDYSILVVGPIPKEVVDRMKDEAPTAYKLYSEGRKLFVDIVELGRRHRVCPYELGKRMLSDPELIDVVVLDSIYLAYRNEPGFRDVFNRSRLLVIDEVHESLFASKLKITIDYTGDRRNILETAAPQAVKYIELAIEEIFNMDKGNLDNQRVELGDKRYEYAVPDTSLKPGDKAYDYIRRAVKIARSVLRRRSRVPLALEAEVSALETLLDLERLSYRVSLADPSIKPGTVVAFKEYGDDRLERLHLVPVLLSPRLRDGEDFGFAIVSSGTLLPLHLTLVFKMRREEAENLLAVVKWPVVYENRVNYIIDYPAYYPNRPEVANAILEAIDCSSPVIVVASTTWEKYLPGFLVAKPAVQYSKAVENTAKIRKYLEESECPRILLSPHLSFSKGEDLVSPEKPFKGVVIAASESILPPDPDTLADLAIVARKYPLPENGKYFIAWQATILARSILRVVQAVGRVQRSEKHKVKVIYIGRFFKKKLLEYYEELYGPINYDYFTAPTPQALADNLKAIVSGGWW